MRAIRELWRWFLRGGWRWAILAALIVAFLWFVPQLQGQYFSQKVPAEERPALVNEYRRTWAQIVGGFGLLLGLYFTWRRIEISQQELEATRDQQVTERFTRAIDQLGATDDVGNKKLEIRLGGIYALERIAVDSFAMENTPGRDYSTVMEVLTAYVRENTSRTPGPFGGSPDAALSDVETTADADEGAEQPAPPEPRRPTADIQAILDVLGRAQTRAPEEYHTRLDLHEAKLQGANLRVADLRRADLRGANLQGAGLREANLQEATLLGADLQGANLKGANLQEANLVVANLQAANLLGADLQGANLQGANLQGGKLRGADLDRAILLGANLLGADLQGAILQVAILQGADLQGAILQGANLLGANLQGASLKGAILQGANLQGANLREADLQKADLQKANFQETNLQGAKITDEQFAATWSLQGATMPDGQTYEDWLEDKEGGGKDVENE